MKLTPVAGPGQVQDLSTPESVRSAEMKAKFIAKVSTPSAQQAHPQATAEVPAAVNPNAISAEEVGAVKVRTQEPIKNDENADLAPAEETAPAAKDPETERRFAQIARAERQLRAKIQQQNIQFKQREAALQAREAALGSPAAPDLSQYVAKDRIKADALSVLEEAGVEWDAVTQQVVNRQPTDPRVTSTIQKLQAKIEQLELANENNQKSYEQQQKDNYQAALKQIRNDAKQLIYTDPEFETVKTMNATKDVVELIERQFAKDGTVLSVEEAARKVENYLVEEGMKVANIDKIKKRMAAASATRTPTDTKTQTNQQPQMKTLTNATGSTRPLTTRERAIAAAEGRLKQ